MWAHTFELIGPIKLYPRKSINNSKDKVIIPSKLLLILVKISWRTNLVSISQLKNTFIFLVCENVLAEIRMCVFVLNQPHIWSKRNFVMYEMCLRHTLLMLICAFWRTQYLSANIINELMLWHTNHWLGEVESDVCVVFKPSKVMFIAKTHTSAFLHILC